jgi:3-dehydrosphinganine reductase
MLELWQLVLEILGGLLLLVGAASHFLADVTPVYNVSGKKVVITGGSSGIGLALAKQLVAKGASVTIVARDKVKLEKAKREIEEARTTDSQIIHAASADVSSYEQVDKTVQGAAAKMKGVDIFVGCAGNSRPGRFESLPIDEFEKMMQVNYLGHVYGARACVPFMRKAGGGRIMLVSSMAGLAGISGFSAYAPAKFAVRGLAEVLHMEYRPFKILTTLVCPPDVDTPGFAEEAQWKPEECKLMSEGLGLFKADQIAADMMDGLRKWRFFVNTGFEGDLSSHLSSGMAPASNSLSVIIDFFSMGLLRVVGLGYLRHYNKIVEKVYKKEGLIQ